MGIWQIGRSALKSLQLFQNGGRKPLAPRSRRQLRLEPLETRTLLTVTVNPITGPDSGGVFDVPSGKNLFVPVTGTDSTGAPINYTVSSSNSNITAQVLTGNEFLELNVSGTNASGAFTGTLVFELFANVAPQTVADIENFVDSGLYNGAEFYRSETSSTFQLIQGGIQPPTGTISGKQVPTSKTPDEFTTQATFNSSGLLAMANAGPNTATTEFFVTGPDRPLADDPQSLNFGYTIFGQLISGTTTYDDILNVPTTASNGIDYDNTPVTITSASIISSTSSAVADSSDQVLEISEPSTYTGTATITVTGTASDGTSQQTFTVDAAPPSATGTSTPAPVYLAPVANQTTKEGTPITVQLSGTDQEGGTLAYSVTGNSTFTGAPSDVTVSVNGSTATLTPTAGFTGTVNLVAHADDSTNNLQDALPFTLTVSPQIAITQTALANGTLNTPYSQTLTATGATGTADFTVTSGTLPPGLTLTTAGLLSGTPSTADNYNFTVTATDSSNSSNTASQAYSLVVDQSVAITTTTVAPWTVNQAGYSQTLAATGGTGAITFSVTSGSLPTGLTLSNNVITGTPTTAGSDQFTVTAKDADGSTATQVLTLVVNPAITISPTSLANWTENQAGYSQTLTTTGGTGAITFAVTSGSLPPGLTLANGVISGTPTAANTYSFTITATDSTKATATQTYSNLVINQPLAITTTTLPVPDVGSQYNATIATTGGTTPLTYSVTSGSLPAGLTLNSNGTITGSPTTPVAAKVTIQVKDASGATASEQYQLNVIGGTLTLSPGSPGTLSDGTAGTALNQTITVVGGTPAYGTPTISNFNAGTTGLTQSDLVVNAAAGTVTVTGVPAAGTLSFTVSDTDSHSDSVTQNYTLLVNPALAITPTTLPQGKAGTAYDETVTVSGGTTPYSTFSVSNFSGGTTGLTASDITSNATAGTFVISGTPTQGGTVTFTANVTDSAGATLTQNYTLTVAGPVITPATLTAATAGTAYHQTITVTDTSSTFPTFTVTNFTPGNTGLTASDITANSSSGTFTISGTPTAAGTATFTVDVTDAAGATVTQNYSITVNAALTVTPASLPGATVNQAYNHTLTVGGGTTPYTTFTITNFNGSTTGLTAADVTTNSTTGVVTISGTPTAAGTATFTVDVVDSAGANVTQNYSLVVSPVLAISPTSLTSATANSVYDHTITVSGGSTPYSSITISSFNAGTTGLTQSEITTNASAGTIVIDGTPTAAGSATFTVSITDAAGATLSQNYTLTVNNALAISPTTLPNATAETAYNQTLTVSGGTAPYSSITIGGFSAGTTGLTASEITTSASAGTVTISGTPTGAGSASFTVTVTDASGATLTQNYTLTVIASNTASLSGYVYDDLAKSGSMSSSDPEIAGVYVMLSGTSSTGTPFQTQTVKTNSSGAYSFTGLAAGTYTISMDQPAGLTGGSSQAGSLSGSASGTEISNIVVSNGAAGTNYNFNAGGLTTKQITVFGINLFLASTPTNGQLLTNTIDSSTNSAATPPVVTSIALASGTTSPTSAAVVDYTVNFSQNVTGVNAADFSLSAGGNVSSAAITSVTGSGKTYTVAANTGSGAGTLGLDVLQSNTIVDANGNSLSGAANGNDNFVGPSYTLSKIAVTVASVTSPINTGNENVTGLSGNGEPGATISVVASDGTHSTTAYTTTVASNTTWTISDINVSSLNDGTITYTATATDSEGATASAKITASKSTTAPSVTVTAGESTINSSNEDAVSLSGTVTAGDTVSVTATDTASTPNKLTQAATVTGTNWSISGWNLSTLVDGTITFTVTATSPSGTTGTATTTLTKNTAAPSVVISSATNPVNFTNEDSVVVNGTAAAGASISVTASDGTHTTSAATTTVPTGSGTGSWTVTGLNLSGLTDGTITYTATATLNGNTATTTFSATKNTTNPTVTVSSVTTPINSSNDTAVAVSGTGENGATVTVTATDSSQTTITVGTATVSNGTWSITGVNVGSLADGTITFTATAKDSIGNTTTASTTATKDTAAPTVAVTTVTSPINSANDSNTSVSGTVSFGSIAKSATITVTATEGGQTSSSESTTVNSAGNWTVSGINVSTLADGTITYNVTVTDSDGNKATASTTSIKDTNPAAVSIASYTKPINISNEDSVSISGTAETGSTVSLVVSDGSGGSLTKLTTTANASTGNWSFAGINVSTLADGTITYTVTDTDAANNTASATATAPKGTVAPTITTSTVTDPINIANQGSTEVTGTGTAGDSVTVVASINGSAISGQTSTVNTNGTWTVGGLNVSGLPDGTITYTATITDAVGNTASAHITSTKDTTTPAVAITSVPGSINLDNEGSLTVSGTTVANANISLTASNGGSTTKAYTTQADGSGNWSISGVNVTALPDGTITFTASTTDTAGNTNQTTATSTMSTVAITSVTHPINIANEDSVMITGTGQDNASVALVATDSAHNQVTGTGTVGGTGQWTISGLNLSTLVDGTITFTVTASDTANNSKTATTTASKDTVAPTVAITAVTTPINSNNDTATTASGTGEDGDVISVIATDGNHLSTTAVTTTVTSGTWTVSGINVSSLADGTITYTVTETDAAGNTAQDTMTTTKDTVAPVVTINPITTPINMTNDKSVTVSGTGTTGDTIALTLDGAPVSNAVATVNVTNGTWTISGVDVSTLADGTVTFTANASDNSGNTATASTTDTKSTVLITSVTSPINASNDTAITVDGTGQAQATINLELNGSSTSVATTTVASNGTWSISGVDVSGLNDGTVTFTAVASDTSGDSASSSLTATKSTVAITTVTNPVNLANENGVSASGTGIPNATIKLEVSDGVHVPVTETTTADSNGDWSFTGVNVSGLNDGNVTYMVQVTNPNSTTGNASMTATKDTVAPTVSSIDLVGDSTTTSDTVAFTVTFSEPVTGVSSAAFQLVPSSGVTGATITSVTGSGTTYTVNASVASGSNGTLGLDLINNGSTGIQDDASNPLGGPASVVGPTYSISAPAPAVTSNDLTSLLLDQALASETSWI